MNEHNWIGCTPESAQAEIARLQAEVERLSVLLGAAQDYDNADDDAYWEPPHPIFQLSEERDAFMRIANEREAELHALRERVEGLNPQLAHLVEGGPYCGALAPTATYVVSYDELQAALGEQE